MSSLYEQSINPPPPVVWDRPADRIRDQAASAYDRARNNPAITAEARLSLIAKAYLAARSAMDAAIPATQGQARVDLAALKKSIFGIDDLIASADAGSAATISISFRDAQARVADLGSDEQASQLLELAEQTSDELMARAIGNAALQPGLMRGTPMFPTTAEQYLSTRPAVAAAYRELTAAQQAPPSISDLLEFALPKPSELTALFGADVTALAAKASAFAAGIGQA